MIKVNILVFPVNIAASTWISGIYSCYWNPHSPHLRVNSTLKKPCVLSRHWMLAPRFLCTESSKSTDPQANLVFVTFSYLRHHEILFPKLVIKPYHLEPWSTSNLAFVFIFTSGWLKEETELMKSVLNKNPLECLVSPVCLLSKKTEVNHKLNAKFMPPSPSTTLEK